MDSDQPPAQAGEHTLHHHHDSESSASSDTGASRVRTEHGSLLADEEADEQGHTAFLRRSPFILIATLLYTVLALYAWVLICILAHRPIGVKQYGVNIRNKDNSGWGWLSAQAYHGLYVRSERYFESARLVQAVVSLLTIPLTTAVCKRAAVTFLQSHRHRPTMRQAMALADGAWTDIAVVGRLAVPGAGGWRRYGSWLLLYAIFLHALGIVISPLREAYLTTKTIRTPTSPQMIEFLVDIPDQFDPVTGRSAVDDGYIAALLRSRLASTTNAQAQINLWSRAPDCSPVTQPNNSLLCLVDGSQHILANMSLLQDPFFAQLPTGFSTGLIRQFAPRINSTAQRENISAAAFPAGCAEMPDALWLRYANGPASPGVYAVEVCMPGNMTASPWQPTRARQDFREELYLNITFSAFDWLDHGPANGSYYTKITLDTTAGYFELPNDMNGGVGGPLIDGDPSDYCDDSCASQGPGASGPGGQPDPIADYNLTRRAPQTGLPIDAAQQLRHTRNKGPLLFVALALFGMGSFIDKAQSYESYFATAKDNNGTGSICLDAVPFMPLLHDWLDQRNIDNALDPCLTLYGPNLTANPMPSQVVYYLSAFLESPADSHPGERVQNAFAAAAFLASQTWMSSITTGSLWVSYDSGADTPVPAISDAAIRFLSVLLGVYLGGLLALAVYSTLSPHWTPRLDAFAMMRIGAALADRFPLALVEDTAALRALDKTPGWIGDASGGMGSVGELGVGAEAPLVARRRYRCLEPDRDDAASTQTGKPEANNRLNDTP